SAANESYAHLLHDSLLQPLHMWDTTLAPSADQCARLLRSSRNEGPCTDTQPSGPSGGVYSTPADMAKFLQYVLHSPGAPPQPAGALDVYIRPQQLRSIAGLNHVGRATGIGLAWIQLGDPDSPSMVMAKTGGGAGFGTYIVVSPQHHTGIFLAITEGRGGATVNIYHEVNTMLADLSGVPPLPPKAQVLRPAKHPANARNARLSKPQPKLRNARPAKRAPKLHSAPPAKHAPKANPQKTKPRTKHPAPAHPTPKRRRM
ncbi:MAG: serine hydrolase, partial [Devosia sp.]|nr:serine hydrolase [Devosia sp.]